MATDYERIISEAIEDCGTIQEAVNEVKIVSPRYGDDFKSLPMIAAEAQDTIGEWESAISLITQEGGVPALAVSDASGKTQQEVNDLTGAPYRVKVGGYKIGERVVLENGDIVTSTVAGNTVNPNVDMTGWVSANSASQIIDESGNTQQEINNTLGFDLSLELKSGLTPTQALKKAAANGAKSIRIASGEYTINETVEFTSDVYLDFEEGAVLNLGSTGSLKFTGSIVDLGVLRSDINKTSFSFTIDDASDIKQGDLLLVHNSEDGSFAPHRYYYRAGEFFKVYSRIGNVVSIFGYPFDNYAANSTTKVYKVNPIHVDWSNLQIKATDDNERPLIIDLAEDLNLSRFANNTSKFSGITLYRSYNVSFDAVSANNAAPVNTTNYGISFVGCQNCTFWGGTLGATRHAISITGTNQIGVVNRDIKITGATLSSFQPDISAIDAHGNSEFITYDNCVGTYAVLAGANNTLSNSVIYSSKSADGRCFYASEIVGGILNIIDCTFMVDGDFNNFSMIDVRPSSDLKRDFVLNVKGINVFKNGATSLNTGASIVRILPSSDVTITKKISVVVDDVKLNFDDGFGSVLNISYGTVRDSNNEIIPTGYLKVDNIIAGTTSRPYLIRNTNTALACTRVYEMRQNGHETVTTVANAAVTRNAFSMFKYQYSRKPSVLVQLSPDNSSVSFDNNTFNTAPTETLRVPTVINGSSSNERCRPTILWNKRIAAGDGEGVVIRLDWESVVNTM